MMRKLKFFGLGLIVVLAGGASVVVSAPASEADKQNPGHFTAESGTVRITAEQTMGADQAVFHNSVRRLVNALKWCSIPWALF